MNNRASGGFNCPLNARFNFARCMAWYIAITNHVADSTIPRVNKHKWNSKTHGQMAAVAYLEDKALINRQ